MKSKLNNKHYCFMNAALSMPMLNNIVEVMMNSSDGLTMLFSHYSHVVIELCSHQCCKNLFKVIFGDIWIGVNRHFPYRHFPYGYFLYRHFPYGHFPYRHFLYRHFPYRHFSNLLQCPRNNGLKSRLSMRS